MDRLRGTETDQADIDAHDGLPPSEAEAARKLIDDHTAGRKPPQLVGSKQTYEQEGDCWASDEQTLEIEMTDRGGGSYWVISTGRWAVDDIEEMVELLEKAGVERRAKP